jgi:phage anti-repressor protein
MKRGREKSAPFDNELLFVFIKDDKEKKMNELIKVVECNGKQAVNARDLHEALEVGRYFSNWIKGRIEEYGFVEGEDYSVVSSRNGGDNAQEFSSPHPTGGNLGEKADDENHVFAKSDENLDGNADNKNLIFAESGKNQDENWGGKRKGAGRFKDEYLLSVGMAKELAMVENNEKGRYVRRYLIRVEEIFRSAMMGLNLAHNAVFKRLSDVLERQENLIETLTLASVPRIPKEQFARIFIQTHMIKTGNPDHFCSRMEALGFYKLLAGRIEGARTLNLKDFALLVKMLYNVGFSESKDGEYGWYGIKLIQ